MDDFWTGLAGLSGDSLYRAVRRHEPTPIEDLVGDDQQAQWEWLKTI